MSTGGTGALRGLKPVIISLTVLAVFAILAGLLSMSWAHFYPLRPYPAPPREVVELACQAATKVLDGVPAKEEGVRTARKEASTARREANNAEKADVQATKELKERRAKYKKSKARADKTARDAAKTKAKQKKTKAKQKRDAADTKVKDAKTAQDDLKKLGSDAHEILRVAGVADHNYRGLPTECRTQWTHSQMISSGISVSAVTGACGDARESLMKGAYSKSRSALAKAGVTNDNVALLGDDCEVWWNLAAAPTEGRTNTAKPTASSSNPSKKTAAPLEKLACALAAKQLNSGKPGDAHKTLRAAGVTTKSSPACAAVLTLAVGLKPEPPASSESNTIQERAQDWESFLTSYAVPLKNLGLFALGGWLALFVLARLLVEIPLLRHRASTRRQRRMIGLLGWSLLILTPLLVGAAGVATGKGLLQAAPLPLIAMFIALGVLGLVASLGLAAWLATLLKLTITVDDKSKLNQTQIVERLRGLASGVSGSIEIQSASTIDNVSTTLTDLSAAKWVAAVQKVVLFLVGISPWQVTVNAAEREAFVSLARNGRTVHAATVQTEGPGLEPLRNPPQPVGDNEILAVFVAAEMLLAMRPSYAGDFDPGLNGATKARSVALQYIAARWYMATRDTRSAVTLLRTAVATDPSNQLAAVTLENARWRGSSDPNALRDYGNWLDQQLDDAESQP